MNKAMLVVTNGAVGFYIRHDSGTNTYDTKWSALSVSNGAETVVGVYGSAWHAEGACYRAAQ